MAEKKNQAHLRRIRKSHPRKLLRDYLASLERVGAKNQSKPATVSSSQFPWVRMVELAQWTALLSEGKE